MENFPASKVFYVILEGNITIKPFAVTLYSDYCHEDIYASIFEELLRQSDWFHLELQYKSPSLLLEGNVVQPKDVLYEMFENGAEYVIGVQDEEE